MRKLQLIRRSHRAYAVLSPCCELHLINFQAICFEDEVVRVGATISCQIDSNQPVSSPGYDCKIV